MNDATERVDTGTTAGVTDMDTNTSHVGPDTTDGVDIIASNDTIVDTNMSPDTNTNVSPVGTDTNDGVDITASNDTIVMNRGTNNNDTTDGVEGQKKRTIYIGHTGRSHHSRMMEHLSSIGSKRNNLSGIAKHHYDHHNDTEHVFSSKIVHVHKKNLSRLACEALHMLNNGHHYLINRRGEFGKMTLHRLDVRERGAGVG